MLYSCTNGDMVDATGGNYKLYLRPFAVILLFLLNLGLAWAQPTFYPSTSVPVLRAVGDTMSIGFGPGIQNPMFSQIDLNNDGLLDIVAFEKLDGTTSCYLAYKKGTSQYIYAPQYNKVIPRWKDWAFSADFNGDGRYDLFLLDNDPDSGDIVRYYQNEKLVGKEDTVFFRLHTPIVRYDSKSQSDNQFPFSRLEHPTLADVDGDGDLDVLVVGLGDVKPSLYQNRSVEDGHGRGSLHFWLVDQCWGKFVEGPDIGTPVRLARSCDQSRVKTRGAHSGSAPLLIDQDADGDLDLLLGTAALQNVVLLENGKKDRGFPRDSMIAFTNIYPFNRPLNLGEFIQSNFIDVDNDGRRDLVFTSLDPASTIADSLPSRGVAWYYRDSNIRPTPIYQYRSTSFLESDILDLGYRSKPSFFDFDEDGDDDLLISSFAPINNGKVDYDMLTLYENTGDGSRASFILHSQDYLSLSSRALGSISPTTVDLDGDNRKDIVIGTNGGELLYFRNSASAGNQAIFTTTGAFLTATDSLGNSPGNIKLANSYPAFWDADKDGDLDLLVGQTNGTLAYYRNFGNKSVPSFRLMSTTYGGVINKSNKATFSAPAIFDLDRNGTSDLVLGSNNDSLRYASSITDNYRKPLTFVDLPIFDFGRGSKKKIKLGNRLSPAFSFLDGDTLPDMVLGNLRGGITLYTSKNNGLDTVPVGIREYFTLSNTKLSAVLQVYPNPTQDVINLETQLSSSTAQYKLLNLSGQVIQEGTIAISDSKSSIHVKDVEGGIYFLTLIGSNGEVASTKVVLF